MCAMFGFIFTLNVNVLHIVDPGLYGMNTVVSE